MTIHRDVELRGQGYEPAPSPFQYQDPSAAFARVEVREGCAVVFQTGSDIWGVYLKPSESRS